MAEKRRVQVQGLGGAVPSLQSAIPGSIGRTRTQVQQATPWQESKLGQLSQVLGVTVAGVSELKQIGEQQIQRDIEDLASKSPEELDKISKNIDGAFDKEVRKGGLRWLASPVNRERRGRAIGQLKAQDLISQITVRLENPEQGDTDSNVIIKELQDKFIEENPGIRDSVLAREGLQSSLNKFIPSLRTNFDRKINARARYENGEAVVAGFYDLIDNLKSVEEGGLKDGDIASGLYTQEFNEFWENTNAHSPIEQEQLFKRVLVSLAKNGHADEARELRVWAADNKLKFGTATLSELKQDELDDLIEDTEEQAEGIADREQQDILREASGELFNALSDIKEKKTVGQFNGISVSTPNQLIDLVLETNEYDGVRLTERTKSELRRLVIRDVNTYKSPVTKGAEDAVVTLTRDANLVDKFDPTSDSSFPSQVIVDLSNSFGAVATDVVEKNPNILTEVYNDLKEDLMLEAESIASEADDPTDILKIKNKLIPKYRVLEKTAKAQLYERYEKLTKLEQEKRKFIEQEKNDVGNEKVLEDSGFQKFSTIDKLESYVKVLSNINIKEPSERNKAENLIKEIDLQNISDIANKRVPIEQKVSYHWGQRSEAVRYANVDEVKQLKTLIKQSYIHLGYYLNPQILEDGVLPTGERFDPLVLDSKFIPILSAQEIEQDDKTSPAVIRKARLIGKGDDIDGFLKEQKELKKSYEDKKFTYPKFEEPQRPVEYRNPFGF